jgi:O-antigen ligase
MYAIFSFVTKKGKLKPIKPSVLLLVFFFCALLSLYPIQRFDKIESFLPFLILPLSFLVVSIRENITKEVVFNFCDIAMVLYSLYTLLRALFKFLETKSLNVFYYHDLSGNLNNMSAIYLSMLVSFSLLIIISKKNKNIQELSKLLILATLLVLLSSKTIIGITILIVSVFGLKHLFIKKTFKKKYILYLLIILSLSLASKSIRDRVKFEYQKTKIEEVLNKKEFGHVYLWTGIGLRAFQVRAFYEIFREGKVGWLGLGYKNSQEALDNKYKEYNFYPGFYGFNFHNQYVQTFAELGVIGFLMMLLLFGFLLYNAIKSKDFLFISFVVLVFSICFTESLLWRQRGMIFFIVLSLLFYNSYKKPINSVEKK